MRTLGCDSHSTQWLAALPCVCDPASTRCSPFAPLLRHRCTRSDLSFAAPLDLAAKLFSVATGARSSVVPVHGSPIRQTVCATWATRAPWASWSCSCQCCHRPWEAGLDYFQNNSLRHGRTKSPFQRPDPVPQNVHSSSPHRSVHLWVMAACGHIGHPSVRAVLTLPESGFTDQTAVSVLGRGECHLCFGLNWVLLAALLSQALSRLKYICRPGHALTRSPAYTIPSAALSFPSSGNVTLTPPLLLAYHTLFPAPSPVQSRPEINHASHKTKAIGNRGRSQEDLQPLHCKILYQKLSNFLLLSGCNRTPHQPREKGEASVTGCCH